MVALAVPNGQTGSTLPRASKDPEHQLMLALVLQFFAVTPTTMVGSVSTQWPVLLRDPAATGVWVEATRPPATVSEILDEIKGTTGLTWAQIARVMGVSRRSIHLWLQGKTVSSTNEERLHGVLQIIRSLGGRSQLDVRSRILDKSGGASVADLLAVRNDAAAAALAHERVANQAAPMLFESATSRSREALDARSDTTTALDRLESGSGPVHATSGRPKRARRITRETADGR